MYHEDAFSQKSVFVANHNQTGKLLKPGDEVIDSMGDRVAIFVRAESRKVFIRYKNSDEIFPVPPGRLSLALREKKPVK